MLKRDELEEEFFGSFPIPFWKDACTALVAGYKESTRSAKSLNLGSFEHWELPYLRRSIIEARLYAVAQRYLRSGITVKVDEAKRGGGPYLLLSSGVFQLTVSMVKSIDELPRIASFRVEKSQFNATLFEDEEDVKQRDTYYAVLTHLPHHQRDEPSAVRIKFPEGDYERAYHVIDLKSKFSDVFETKPVTEEKIAEPKPQLRKKKRDQNSDGTGDQEDMR